MSLSEIGILYPSEARLCTWQRNPCWQAWDFSCSFSWGLHTFLVYASLKKRFSSLHRISYRTEVWLANSRTLMPFFFRHLFVSLVVCFGSLSCWKTHLRPIFRFLAEERRFFSKVWWYVARNWFCKQVCHTDTQSICGRQHSGWVVGHRVIQLDQI